MFSLMTCIKFDKFQSYADPGIFVRGGPGQSDKKKSSDIFISSAYFTEVKWLISKKTIIVQGSRGVQLFPGGSNCKPI